MAYNPTIYQPYGQMYGQNYGQSYGFGQGYQQNSQMSQGQQGMQTQPSGMIWVDGEVGAKAYQLPAGWPMNVPLPLWDTNDTIIYLKSTNQMGIPNPIQKIHYKMDEQGQRTGGMDMSRLESGSTERTEPQGQTVYARKEDLTQMKEELMDAIRSMQGTAAQDATAAKGGRANGKPAV